MPLVGSELLVEARRDGVGVGAFNMIAVEQGEAIVTGAGRTGRPVILPLSRV